MNGCGHCGYTGPLESKGQPTVAETSVQHDQVYGEFDVDTVWSLYACPQCGQPTLCTYVWAEPFSDPETTEEVVLYPTARDNSAVPALVRREVEMARRLKSMDAGMFALCIRRVLEAVCIDQKATGDNLYRQLQDLVNRGLLPQVLADAATELRRFGNLGAHVGDREVTQSDLPLLDDLAEATLDYLYRTPAKVAAVQARYDQKRSSPPSAS